MTATLDPRANVLGTAGVPAEVARGLPPRMEPPAEEGLAPIIRRESLTWSGGRGGAPLLVALDAENPHEKTTPAVLARLAIAPFGAFLPLRTVDAFGIPSLLPGARVRLQRTLAPFLLPVAPPADPMTRAFEAVRTGLAAWGGNLEVRIGARPAVERHCARLDCLQPGKTNLMFAMVSCARDDAVRYDVSGADADWTVSLTHGRRGIHGGEPVSPAAWYPAHPMAYLQIVVAAPAEPGAERGVVVHVTRRSDGTSLPVEFQLQAARA